MGATEKVSMSLDAIDLKFIRRVAKRENVSVSALVSQAIRAFRVEEERRQALAKLLSELQPDERVTEEEMDALEEQWRA